jgi:hypothetical protein
MQAQLLQTLRDADLRPALDAVADILGADLELPSALPNSALPLARTER